MEQEVFMPKEEVIETLNDFVFGNFEISMKVKTAINEAVCMLEKKEESIDRVLEIIDKVTTECEVLPTEIDDGREKAAISFEKKDGMLAMASMIRVLVLALKGGEHEDSN